VLSHHDDAVAVFLRILAQRVERALLLADDAVERLVLRVRERREERVDLVVVAIGACGGRRDPSRGMGWGGSAVSGGALV
tara:strand:+ start:374 stop:613 length:240 start_codon:yes stop_codon:yes gene_type:complete